MTKTKILSPSTSGLALTEGSTSPILILLSGFPDPKDTWDKLAPHFESTHHVIKIAYPGMDQNDKKIESFWGYSSEDVAIALQNEIIQPINRSTHDIYLLGHDWGALCVLLYLTKYPQSVTKSILLDVGMIKSSEMGLKQALVIAGYQIFLCINFLLWRLLFCFFGDTISNILCGIFIGLYPWKFVGPCPDKSDGQYTRMNMKKNGFHPRMCYPYLRFLLNAPKFRLSYPKVPQLFCYGARKRIMFHSQRYIDKLSNDVNSRSKCFEETGHWLHWSHADELAVEMKKFMDAKIIKEVKEN